MSWYGLNQIYYIKKCLKTKLRPNKGYYFLSAYFNSKILMLDNPSLDKHWQKKYFLRTGVWKDEQGL